MEGLASVQISSKMGELAEDDMRETFNLGLGMILAVKPENVDALVGLLEDENESWYKVGQLKKRPDGEEKLFSGKGQNYENRNFGFRKRN